MYMYIADVIKQIQNVIEILCCFECYILACFQQKKIISPFALFIYIVRFTFIPLYIANNWTLIINAIYS